MRSSYALQDRVEDCDDAPVSRCRVRFESFPRIEERGTILPFPKARPVSDPAALIRAFLATASQAEVRPAPGAGTKLARSARPLRRTTMDGRDLSHYLHTDS